MPGPAQKVIITLLIVCAISGCTHSRNARSHTVQNALPVTEAPKIELSQETTPVVSTVSHQLEPKIKFVDKRPDEEKLYYPGETDPRRMHDAMTILPMESFQPYFDTALRRQIVNNLETALHYDSIEVHITSFHVALDERERAEAELAADVHRWDTEKNHKDLLDAEERAERNKDKDLDDKIGQAIVRGMFVNPIQQNLRARKRYEQTKVAPQSLPKSLTDNKKAGWNCILKANVVLVEDDGNRTSLPVHVDSQLPHKEWLDVNEEIQQAVTAALEDFGIRLSQDAKRR